MPRSIDRFLTTHTSSLPRPDDLISMMYAKEEGERLFGDPATYLAADPHIGEMRYRAMGRNTLGRPLFVVFTLRRIGEGLIIRPISARYAHEKEATRWPAN
jgi:uncharacterized DUF497 family protein